MIDFKRIADDLLSRSHELVPSWLPGGKIMGHEYCCASLKGGKGDSFKVNLNTGKWAEFASGTGGIDLLALYAAIHGVKNSEAARMLGYGQQNGAGSGPKRRQAGQEAKSGGKTRHKRTSSDPGGQKPPEAEPDLTHPTHGKPSHVWPYTRSDGSVFFCVARYDPPEGRKQIVPWLWENGKWLPKAPPEPRPLYRLHALDPSAAKPVIVAEGEKCADAVAKAVGDAYDVTTWPGGAMAVDKADWEPLRNRKVIIWPDADEPGLRAACMVYFMLVNIASGAIFADVEGMPEGWDAADAAKEGWDRAAFMKWIAEHVTAAMPDADVPPQKKFTILWERMGLTLGANGRPIPNIDNISCILESWPPMQSMVRHEQFSDRRVKKDGSQWTDADTLALTIRIQREMDMPRVSDDVVRKAAVHCAQLNSYHAVKDWLEELAWDKHPRVDDFLRRAMGVDETKYSRAVSRNLWLSLAARVYDPGCQCDYMPILEGKQGIFKSKALRTIGGPWYTSTHENVTHKDFFVCLEGKMLVEIAELDAFGKAETSKIKEVLTTPSDYYRKPYAREAGDYKRACVFVGTTNQDSYLGDETGARRFWPVRCGSIDLAYIVAQRDQLFAEAVARFKGGEPWHDMPREDAEREQEARRVVDEWEPIVEDYLENFTRVKMAELAKSCLQIEPGRLDRQAQKRIAVILKRIGWNREHSREGKIWSKPSQNGDAQ